MSLEMLCSLTLAISRPQSFKQILFAWYITGSEKLLTWTWHNLKIIIIIALYSENLIVTNSSVIIYSNIW